MSPLPQKKPVPSVKSDAEIFHFDPSEYKIESDDVHTIIGQNEKTEEIAPQKKIKKTPKKRSFLSKIASWVIVSLLGNAYVLHQEYQNPIIDVTALWVTHPEISTVDIWGVQAYLTELAYYNGPINGEKSDDLTKSVIAFQEQIGTPDANGIITKSLITEMATLHQMMR